MGDLGSSYIAAWVGDLITLGAAISAFGCCLACVVGASRLLFALARDLRARPAGWPRTGRERDPGSGGRRRHRADRADRAGLRGVLRRRALRHVPVERARSAR